jgi:hypothetical protein
MDQGVFEPEVKNYMEQPKRKPFNPGNLGQMTALSQQLPQEAREKYLGAAVSGVLSHQVLVPFGADDRYIQNLGQLLYQQFLSLRSNAILRRGFGEHQVSELAARVYQDLRYPCSQLLGVFGLSPS